MRSRGYRAVVLDQWLCDFLARHPLANSACSRNNGTVAATLARPKRRTRIVTAGIVYTAIVLVIGLAAGTRPNNLLIWIFSCLLAAMLASGVVSGLMMMPLRAVRIEPRRGRVGEPLVVRYEITNTSRIVPAFDLHVSERALPPSLDTAGTAWILHVGPRDRVHAEAVFRPCARGVMRFRGFEVSSTFPFDLLRKVLIFDQSVEVLVHPEVRALRADILARVTAGGIGGQRLSSKAGGTDDFFGVREYRSGDSVRQIAWKRLAGTGKLATIERSRSVPPRVRILLDLRRATRDIRVVDGEDPRALEERAIVFAASFIALADKLGYEFALSVAGFEVPTVGLRKGHFHREKLMSLLAAIDLDMPRTVGNGLAQSDERATMIVVHTDRAETDLAPVDAWHFTARQLDQCVEGALAAAKSAEGASA